MSCSLQIQSRLHQNCVALTFYFALPSQHLGKQGLTLSSLSPTSPFCLFLVQLPTSFIAFSIVISILSAWYPKRTSARWIPCCMKRRSCFANMVSFILFHSGLCFEWLTSDEIRSREIPAVTRIARHNAEIIWKETLLSNPFRDNRTKIGCLLGSTDIAGATTVSKDQIKRKRMSFVETFARGLLLAAGDLFTRMRVIIISRAGHNWLTTSGDGRRKRSRIRTCGLKRRRGRVSIFLLRWVPY